MVGPDDFGMSAVRTLAHVAAPSPPSWHGAFWQQWEQAVAASASRLNEFRGASPDATDASATHWIESIGHLRIGCRLIEPPRSTPIRGALLALHGYRRVFPLSGEDETWRDLASRGVLVAAIRVRGFPGSCMDCPDFRAEPGGWIGRGLVLTIQKPQDAMQWSLVQGVADAACALIALQRELARRFALGAPLMVFGPSFGGGLAVMALARAVLPGGARPRVDRLTLALPSLGDWSWRLGQGDRGSREGIGAEVRSLRVTHADREEEIAQTLSIADAAAHARDVPCPTLCMLAAQDDVVPAPSAAAVFNAMASSPGDRWRFLVPYGHFDGGLRNARRHALFERCRNDFLDPRARPADLMAPWEPVLEHGDRAPAGPSDPQASAVAIRPVPSLGPPHGTGTR